MFSDDRPDDDEMWGVYEIFCPGCGKKVVAIATVHSVENGYAEALSPDFRCSGCEARAAMAVN